MEDPDGTRARRIWGRWALAWLLVGVAVRLAVAFPVHRYVIDADAVGVGICALRVLNGETPVFYSGLRLGSLPCYPAAVLFALFGAGRTTLALSTVLVWCLGLPLGYLMYRELLGPRLASYALPFLVVPAPAVAFWTYMPIGYAETLLLCTAALWLAGRLARLGMEERWSSFSFGLACGLGWWNNLLSLGCTGPALAWLSWRRPRLLRSPAFLALSISGFGLGALPWIAFNLRYAWASLTTSTYVRPAEDVAAVVDNAAVLLTYRLRELVAPLEPASGVDPAAGIHQLLRLPVLVLTAAAALAFVLRPLGTRAWSRSEEADRAYGLFLLIAAVILIANAASNAGGMPGPTVRYVLPLYLLVPAVLAVGLGSIRGRSRAPPAALGVVILVFNLASSPLPWSERRREWARLATEDEQLIEQLESLDVDTVIGPYSIVHPITFLSRGAILAVPVEPSIDEHFRVSPALSARPRWALVSDRRERLARWVGKAELAGSRHRVGRFAVFRPRPELYADESAEAFRDRMRLAYF